MAVSKKKKTLKKKVITKKKVKTLPRKIVAKKSVTKKIKKIPKKAVKKNTKQTKHIKVSKTKKVVKKVLKGSIKNPFLSLKRAKHNPIIEPESHKYWESRAAFNPSAICHDGKIHVIYRAVGDSDISVLGYTKSDDGYFFDKNDKELSFYAKNKDYFKKIDAPIVNYSSGGGGSGGCEDPRLTLLGEKVYMFYTAFDGWGSLRIALTSIDLKDFLNRNWTWKEPVMISPPGQIHKNWVLFPEKINGKYAIFHSFAPKILIEYLDNLEDLNGTKFINSNNVRPVDKSRDWDSWFRGVGPSPLKTKYGWLVIYHAMDHKNPDRYRIGAMILDLKDPTKVLYRSTEPILEPDMWYENEGHKRGVIYSCGAVVKDGILFVYYGGADKVCCVATANLDHFLEELINHKVPKLKSTQVKLKK